MLLNLLLYNIICIHYIANDICDNLYSSMHIFQFMPNSISTVNEIYHSKCCISLPVSPTYLLHCPTALSSLIYKLCNTSL